MSTQLLNTKMTVQKVDDDNSQYYIEKLSCALDTSQEVLYKTTQKSNS